jgi:hypothetical protein
LFTRLLNALRRWFAELRSDDAPKSAAPAHWLKVRDPGPPKHWLEAAQRAGPMMRRSAENIQEPAPSRTWPTESRSDDKGAPVRFRAAHGADPMEARMQSRPDASRRAIFDQQPDPDAAPRGLSTTPLKPDVPQHETPASPVLAFETRGTFSKNPVHWPEKQGENGGKHLVTRFFRRLRGKYGRERSLHLIPTASQGLNPETSEQFEPRSSAKVGTQALWQPRSETAQPLPVTRSIPDSAQDSRTSSLNAEWQDAFLYREHVASKFADLSVPRRSPARVEAAPSPVAENQPSADRWPSGLEIVSDPSPICWPELPQPGQLHTAAFSRPSVSNRSEQSSAQNGFPANVPNWWPDFAPDPVAKEYNWRSLLRSVQRSQSLEKEQRGY